MLFRSPTYLVLVYCYFMHWSGVLRAYGFTDDLVCCVAFRFMILGLEIFFYGCGSVTSGSISNHVKEVVPKNKEYGMLSKLKVKRTK